MDLWYTCEPTDLIFTIRGSIHIGTLIEDLLPYIRLYRTCWRTCIWIFSSLTGKIREGRKDDHPFTVSRTTTSSVEPGVHLWLVTSLVLLLLGITFVLNHTCPSFEVQCFGFFTIIGHVNPSVVCRFCICTHEQIRRVKTCKNVETFTRRRISILVDC